MTVNDPSTPETAPDGSQERPEGGSATPAPPEPLSGPQSGAESLGVIERVTPVEHCGNLMPEWVTPPRSECVLRPGHQGSHADDRGARWWYETEGIDWRQRALEAEAVLERTRHIADLIEAGAPWTANHQDTALRIRAALDTDTSGHRYLSTGCLHGHHDYCQAHTGQSGKKKPASCKFCQAPCICPCHQTPAHNTGPTIAEAAAADRRWWNGEKAGE